MSSYHIYLEGRSRVMGSVDNSGSFECGLVDNTEGVTKFVYSSALVEMFKRDPWYNFPAEIVEMEHE